jgi:hypothetical protein
VNERFSGSAPRSRRAENHPASDNHIDIPPPTRYFLPMSLDIKICGLSTAETVAAALDGGASHVGFIFFPKSPRNVTPEVRPGGCAQAARGRALAVAVTVDADDAFLDEIVAEMPPTCCSCTARRRPSAWPR